MARADTICTTSFLFIGSPPCSSFSRINFLNKYRLSPEEWNWRQAQGRRLVHVAIDAYRRQIDAGRYSLHEHPAYATSWEDSKLQRLVNTPGFYLVQGPMCRWGIKVYTHHGVPGYARKETKRLTNSPLLAELLGRVSQH